MSFYGGFTSPVALLVICVRFSRTDYYMQKPRFLYRCSCVLIIICKLSETYIRGKWAKKEPSFKSSLKIIRFDFISNVLCRHKKIYRRGQSNAKRASPFELTLSCFSLAECILNQCHCNLCGIAPRITSNSRPWCLHILIRGSICWTTASIWMCRIDYIPLTI